MVLHVRSQGGKQQMYMRRHNNTGMKLDSSAVFEQAMLQRNRSCRWRKIWNARCTEGNKIRCIEAFDVWQVSSVEVHLGPVRF
jgi:hypothetical protein